MTTFERVPIGPVVLLLAACCIARGQCPVEWSAGFEPSGLTGGRFGDPYAYSFCAFDDGTGPALYVGGSFDYVDGIPASNIARWDGTAWSALGAGTDDVVRTMTVFDDGSGPALYAGGRFFTAGGVSASLIARWDGASWSPLGTGLSGSDNTVASLEVFDDGTGPRLFAGGKFLNAGGTYSPYFAVWDGTAWSSVGSPGGGVHALAVFDDGAGPALFVGGEFNQYGGIGAEHVARFDGASWQPVGSGCDGDVRSLAVHDDGTGRALYAGGSFSRAGSWVNVENIARWDGTAWRPLQQGVPGYILDMTVHDDGIGPDLLVSAQAPAHPHWSTVHRWNGAGWTTIGGGQIRGVIIDAESFDDGSGPALYVGGDLRSIGTTGVGRIARWTLSGWSAMGNANGIDDAVHALAGFDHNGQDYLAACGPFLRAGDVSAKHAARFDGTKWSALGAGLVDAPTCLAVERRAGNDVLYAGGGSIVQGSGGLQSVARWDGVDWTPLEPGPGTVYSMVVFDDGSGPRLHVGTWGGVMRWDGSGFTALGSLPGQVTAMTALDLGAGPKLYAGSWNHVPGGPDLCTVSRWDGATWTTIGTRSSFMITVEGMTVFEDGGGPTLVVCGAGLGVMQWDGTSWTTLWSDAFATPGTLASFDDGSGPALYVGGSGALRVACWDGSAWSTPGPGIGPASPSARVTTLEVFDDGRAAALYAGGSFDMAGEFPSQNIACWRPHRLGLVVRQAAGPGTGILVVNSELTVGAEYFNIVSFETCPSGPGTGSPAFLGLCVSDPASIINQLLLPLGSPPFHFVATQPTMAFGLFQAPAGLAMDVVCFEMLPGAVGCTSPVRRLVVQ